MAGQPTIWSGYWAAATLAPLMPQPGIAGPFGAGQGSAIISASSFPLDLAGFQALIDQVSGEFDQAAARAGYVVPIPSTATSAYVVAQRVARQGAVSEAFRIIYTGPDQKFVDRYETAYQNALKAIEKGDRPLPGAPQDSSAKGRLLPIWSGIASSIITATVGYSTDLDIPNDF